MTVTGASIETHELVKRKLAASGMRYTAGRRVIVTVMQMATGPRTTAELASGQGGSIPLSSLYRTLSMFEETGVLRRHHGTDGVARYELAEWLTGHHHHVVCISCGAIEDVDVPESAERSLDAIASTLGSEAGYRVVDHELEVAGVCPKCDKQ